MRITFVLRQTAAERRAAIAKLIELTSPNQPPPAGAKVAA